MPRLGLGVWKIDNSQVSQVVGWALEAGYRHIDTACAYKNEEGVGRGVRQSGITRDKIFITTKLAVQGFFHPRKAFDTSLSKLKMDYVDLYLLHWPFLNWKNAWRELEKIYRQGLAKSIGVSNFSITQLQDLKNLSGLIPAVNQVELSPFLNRQELVKYCQTEGIIVECYSPLTRGKRLRDSRLADMAASYKKSPAQIMIRWGLQHDFVMIPKSSTPEHLKSNFDVFDFELKPPDMKTLDSLNENYSALLPLWSRK